jgi:ferredoxin
MAGVQVDRSICRQHGQCAIAAPTIFTLTMGELTYRAEIDSADLVDAESAADACPEQAITVEA